MSMVDFKLVMFSVPFILILYFAIYVPLRIWSDEDFAYKLTFKQTFGVIIMMVISSTLILPPLSRFIVGLLPNSSYISSHVIAQLLIIGAGLPLWSFIIWRLAHMNK